MAVHPLVDQRVAGPAVEGAQVSIRAYIGDVGNAADIDEDDGRLIGPFSWKAAGKRPVIGGNQRRALPAKPHVIGAQIMDDIDAEAIRQPLTVPQLHRQAFKRTVEHRLAVEPDDINVAGRQPLSR
jgi:hypothetical protein